jgi:hypothetical protein
MRSGELGFVVVGLKDWPNPPRIASFTPVRIERDKPVGVTGLHLQYHVDGSEWPKDLRCGITSGVPRTDHDPVIRRRMTELSAQGALVIGLGFMGHAEDMDDVMKVPVDSAAIPLDGTPLDCKAAEERGCFGIAGAIEDPPTDVVIYGAIEPGDIELTALTDFELPEAMTAGWTPS